MPFDAMPDVVTKPNLRMLADALRDRSQWPAGFRWDYRYHDSCAIGLGKRLYGQKAFKKMTPWFNLPFSPMFCIFYFTGFKSMSEVTPNDVADGIDRYLARK